MLSDILAFLKFLFDPETRGTINAISNVLAPSGNDWKKQIKTVSAKFSGKDTLSVAPFINTLLRDFKQIGMSSREIKKFTVVFNELIHNAFDHGCKKNKKCKVTVRCTYSPWFVRIEVADNGAGFDFDEIIENAEEGHGLTIVKKLSYRIMSNKKGNAITAYLVDDKLRIRSAVEKYRGYEFLVVKVVSPAEWSYLVTTWEPLHRVVKHASQKLVIIDCSRVHWATISMREFDGVVSEYKAQPGRAFALIVSQFTYETFDVSNFKGDNFHVFLTTEDQEQNAARRWLTTKAKQLKVKSV